jgi:hypothetical protein
MRKVCSRKKSGMLLFSSLALIAFLFLSLGVVSAKELVQKANGTVVPSVSGDNIVLAASAGRTPVTAEIRMYSKDKAAPKWVLSSSEIEALKTKLVNLPKSSRIDVPDWGYIVVWNYNNSELPYSSIYALNNRVILVDAKGERSYYVDTKKVGDWLLLLGGKNARSISQRPEWAGSILVTKPIEETSTTQGGAGEVRNQNLMEYAPYIVVVLILILFAFFAFRKPKTEGA